MLYFLQQHCSIFSNKLLYLKQEKNQRDIFTQEIKPVQMGQTMTKVKLLIAARIYLQLLLPSSILVFTVI